MGIKDNTITQPLTGGAAAAELLRERMRERLGVSSESNGESTPSKKETPATNVEDASESNPTEVTPIEPIRKLSRAERRAADAAKNNEAMGSLAKNKADDFEYIKLALQSTMNPNLKGIDVDCLAKAILLIRSRIQAKSQNKQLGKGVGYSLLVELMTDSKRKTKRKFQSLLQSLEKDGFFFLSHADRIIAQGPKLYPSRDFSPRALAFAEELGVELDPTELAAMTVYISCYHVVLGNGESIQLTYNQMLGLVRALHPEMQQKDQEKKARAILKKILSMGFIISKTADCRGKANRYRLSPEMARLLIRCYKAKNPPRDSRQKTVEGEI